jgi:hypothetical protein
VIAASCAWLIAPALFKVLDVVNASPLANANRSSELADLPRLMILSAWLIPPAIAIWRASRHLRETRERRPWRKRGFEVLPPSRS